jgi:hypothetical protein
MKPDICVYCGQDMNYNPFHSRGTCMRNRIEELKAEVKKWKLEVCKWQDLNSDIEAENALLLKDKAASPAVIAGYRDYNARLKEQLRVRDEELAILKQINPADSTNHSDND